MEKCCVLEGTLAAPRSMGPSGISRSPRLGPRPQSLSGQALRRPPADVVDGNVPKLFVHGRLAPLPRRHIQGRLCMLVGYADFYVVAGN